MSSFGEGISSSIVGDQSAAAPVHGVRQKFRRGSGDHHRDRPSGRSSAESRSTSERKPCYRCGRHGHSSAKCFYKNAKCHFCGEKGHLVQACRRKSRRTTTNYVQAQEAQSDKSGESHLPIFNVAANVNASTTHKPHRDCRDVWFVVIPEKAVTILAAILGCLATPAPSLVYFL